MGIDIRTASALDTKAIAILYWQDMLTEDRVVSIGQHISQFPAFVAEIGNQIIGFAYTEQIAPDVLELENLYVHETHRNRGIGSLLLNAVEVAAEGRYVAIELFNSDLYDNPVKGKRPATSFYLKRGYELILDTGNTRQFLKRLKS
ncbi:MAG TPA: GNAT family N-acetyltransferase [Candidatus Saccharimonadales bacterium]